MMRVVSLVVALILPLGLHAQRLNHPVMVSRDDAFTSPAAPLAWPDTVRVLALMVQFQKDTDTRTTGDGQFDLTTPATPVLDAPPRDAAYFRDHLRFLENYYGKVSKGKVLVTSTLLDPVVTLPTVMSTYSPPRGGSNAAVANLARDSWRAADSLGLVPDFSAFDAFVVFHAGAGREIDLVGQLGYDPTPLDIPSLYFGLNAFREFFGADYPGIPVGGGAFHITNTLVIPETETRSLPSATGGDVPLYLSINGLLCASLGNYLGLPDLFDTRTGASGIGRFGLMDGQAIFSFSGGFPPEPSAWEKYWLGWITPITVPPGTSTLLLPAVALADSIYRVPISAVEYLLVENRNRDPFRTGQTVTSVYRGVTRQQTFARDTLGFEALDLSAVTGVVTDVTSFDWSLPGALDADGTWYDGGVLIWHIDEAVIAQAIGSNAVNANPARRGVDLLEADGSQDIGESYGFLSAGSGSEAGTPLDYWFLGNIAPVYKNELSSTTFPSSKSNSGGNSHITVSGFSQRGPRMTAVVQLGDDAVRPLPGFPKSLGQALPPHAVAVTEDSNAVIFVATAPNVQGVTVPQSGQGTPGWQADSIPPDLAGKLYAWRPTGLPAILTGSPTGLIATAQVNEDFIPGPAVGDLNGDGIIDCVVPRRMSGSNAARMKAYTLRDTAPVDTLADLLFDVSTPRGVNTVPVIADSVVAFGEYPGTEGFIRFDGTLFDTSSPGPTGSYSVVGISQFSGTNTFVVLKFDGSVKIVQYTPGGLVELSGSSRNFGRSLLGPAASAEFSGATAIAFITADGYLFLIDAAMSVLPGFPVRIEGAVTAPPALADIDGDGSRDIVAFGGSSVCVYNRLGVSLDRFPVRVPGEEPLTSNAVVADMDGDGKADIVGVTGDGVVVAIGRDGKMVRGFPLAAGQGTQSVAAFRFTPQLIDPLPTPHEVTKIGLVVASSGDGSVSAWTTGELSSTPGASWVAPWPQYQKDARHSGFDGSTLTPVPLASQEFFPASRAYNWPNPVYDGITHIRYFVKEHSTVRVKIFDLAGDLVTEMPGPGIGGMDNEVQWNVGNVQSGIYFARIEASGAGGSGIAVVKVAVVK